jgi:hypothetical protein
MRADPPGQLHRGGEVVIEVATVNGFVVGCPVPDEREPLQQTLI